LWPEIFQNWFPTFHNRKPEKTHRHELFSILKIISLGQIQNFILNWELDFTRLGKGWNCSGLTQVYTMVVARCTYTSKLKTKIL
jgi:hypothetical protein